MPKICINGVVREMTLEEIEELERQMAEIPEQPKTAEQRIAELEEALELLLKQFGEVGNM